MVTLYGQALERFRKGRTEEARTLLEQSIASDGADPETLTLLASCCFRMGEYRRTEDLLRQAVDKNPYRARYHFNLALAFDGQGKLEDAIHACRNSLHLQPDFPRARDKLLELEARAGEVPRRKQAPEVPEVSSESKTGAASTAFGGAAGASAGVGSVLKVLIILAVIAFFASLLAIGIGFFVGWIDLSEWLSGICGSIASRAL